MKVLVTGGAGFIGMNLTRCFSSADTRSPSSMTSRTAIATTSTVLTSSSSRARSWTTTHLLRRDGWCRLRGAPGGARERSTQHHRPDALAHGQRDRNAAGARGGRGQRGEPRDHSSSSSVYGMNPALPKAEREWVRPMSPYAVTKLATEQYALAYQQSFGLETPGVPLLQRLWPRPAARTRLRRGHPCLHRRTAHRAATCRSMVTVRSPATSPL